MQVAAFLKHESRSFKNIQARLAPVAPSVGVNSLVRVQLNGALPSHVCAKMLTKGAELTHPLPSRPSLMHFPSR